MRASPGPRSLVPRRIRPPVSSAIVSTPTYRSVINRSRAARAIISLICSTCSGAMREGLSSASFGASAEAHGGEATTPRTSTKYTAALTRSADLTTRREGSSPASWGKPSVKSSTALRPRPRPSLSMAAWTAASDALRSSRCLGVQGLGVRPHDRRAVAGTLVASPLQPVASFDPLACPGVVVLDDAQRLVLGHELRPDVPGPAPEPRHEGPEILPVLHQRARPARAGAGGEDRDAVPLAEGLVQEALDRGSGLDGAPRREMDVVRHDEEARSLGRRREVRGDTRGGRRSRGSEHRGRPAGRPAGTMPSKAAISWGTPPSRTTKSSRVRPGTGCPWESTTTASTVISSTRLGNTGGWSCPVLREGRQSHESRSRPGADAKLAARSSSVSTQPRARRPPRSRSADDAPPR